MEKLKKTFEELFTVIVMTLGICFVIDAYTTNPNPSLTDHVVYPLMVTLLSLSFLAFYLYLYFKPILRYQNKTLSEYYRQMMEAEHQGDWDKAKLLERASDLYVKSYCNLPMAFGDFEDCEEAHGSI